MIYGFVFGTLEPVLPPFFYGTLTVAFIGMYLAVFNGVFTLTQPVFGRLSDRYGEMRIIYLGIVVIIVILPLVVLTTNPVIWFILLIVLAVCDAATATPSLSLLNRGVGDEERGMATSLYNILFSIGALTGPIMIGAIIDGVGYLPAMLTMSMVCFIVLLLIMNRYKSLKL
jgi:MFS family permease